MTGLKNRTLRAVRAAREAQEQRERAAARTRDPDAHQLAQAVYNEAIAWKQQGQAVNMAALSVGASLAAPGVARELLLPEEAVPEVAAFLVSQFLAVIGDVSREGYDCWLVAMRGDG